MTARPAIAENDVVSHPSEYVPDLSFHRAIRYGASTDSSLTLTVGGISLALTGLTTAQAEALKQRYGIFCRSVGGDPDILVRVGPARRAGFLRIREKDELHRIDSRWEGETLMACSYEWAGWLDQGQREGGLALADIALEDDRAFDRSMENYLRVAFARLIIGRGGFLLHSAGLVRNGRAFLFFGPSGSGKTTVTRLSPEALILSDDLTMVVTGSEGDYRACSVPFRGLFAPAATTDATWPLAGFFRLVQDSSDRLVQVEGSRAVGELVGSLPFVMDRPDRPEIAGEAIDAVAAATRKVPVFRLHFRKDRTFWQVVGARYPFIDGFSGPGGY